MPIYDFACRTCGGTFEELVRSDTVVRCPACHSSQIDRRLSLPARLAVAGKPADWSGLGPPPEGGCCGGACHGHSH